MRPRPSASRQRRVVGVASICFAVLLAAAGPVEAQDRPPTQPSCDAAVTYSGGPGQPLHMAWLAAAHLSRSDVAPRVWSLNDEAKHTTVVVNDRLKAVLPMPSADPT